jgi:hypothetical protein
VLDVLEVRGRSVEHLEDLEHLEHLALTVHLPSP